MNKLDWVIIGGLLIILLKNWLYFKYIKPDTGTHVKNEGKDIK